MSKRNWQKDLGWNEEHLDELRTTGYSYIRQGKYELALSFFEALDAINSNDPYDCQTLGALYIEVNQPSRALRYLDKALRLDADHTPTLLNLTKAFFMLGKKEDALRLCRILKDDPSPPIANMAKAMLLAYS